MSLAPLPGLKYNDFFHVLPPSNVTYTPRLGESIAVTDVVARIRFAGTGPHDIFIRRIDCDRADCGDRLLFEHRLPGCAAVARFPDAATGSADIIELIVLRRPRNGCNAA